MTTWCRPAAAPSVTLGGGSTTVTRQSWQLGMGPGMWLPRLWFLTPRADRQRQLLVQVHPLAVLPGAPSPDSLVSVEVRAIAGQVHQAQAQPGRGQAGPQRVAPPGWRIARNHGQRGSERRARRCQRKAAGVAGLLWPDSSVTSTSPVPRLTGPYHEHPVPAHRTPPLDPRPR